MYSDCHGSPRDLDCILGELVKALTDTGDSPGDLELTSLDLEASPGDLGPMSGDFDPTPGDLVPRSLEPRLGDLELASCALGFTLGFAIFLGVVVGETDSFIGDLVVEPGDLAAVPDDADVCDKESLNSLVCLFKLESTDLCFLKDLDFSDIVMPFVLADTLSLDPKLDLRKFRTKFDADGKSEELFVTLLERRRKLLERPLGRPPPSSKLSFPSPEALFSRLKCLFSAPGKRLASDRVRDFPRLVDLKDLSRLVIMSLLSRSKKFGLDTDLPRYGCFVLLL